MPGWVIAATPALVAAGALTTTATAGLVTLVLGGELRGALFEGSCDAPGARTVLSELGAAAGGGRAIVVSTGDLLGPEPLSGFAFRGPPGVQDSLLDMFRGGDRQPVFDAVLLGNGDLSSPPERLERLAEVVPWTVANLGDGPPARRRRHRVFVRAGYRIGVAAVIHPSVAASIDPSRRPRLQAPGPALEKATRVLLDAGVDAVVGLVHVRRSDGLSTVVQLLQKMKTRPQLVLTSSLEGDPSLVRLDGLGVTLVPAPAGGERALSIIRLPFDRGRRMMVSQVDLVRRSVEPVPSGSADLVRNWVCQQLDRPVGTRGRAGELSREAFTQLTLEVMRRATGAEVALISTRSLGPDSAFPLPERMTRLDVRRALPTDDRLRVIELRGAELSRIQGVVKDSRVAVAGLSDALVAGRPIEGLRTYRIVSTDFLAEGGDELIDPAAMSFAEGAARLRGLVLDALERPGRPEPSQPKLFELRVDVGASLKTVNVQNPSSAEAPQLSRTDFLGLTGDLQLRMSFDLPSHRFELSERTRFGVVQEPDAEGNSTTRENEDVTVIEFDYAGRLAGRGRPWIPNAGATARLETELTIPDERDYRRTLLQLGVGPSWQLSEGLSLRSQLGLRRELDASPSSQDSAEAAIAQTRVAVLSTAELRNIVFGVGGTRTVVLNGRIDHTTDLSGTIKDEVVQGRLALDVPIVAGISATAGIDVYILSRDFGDGTTASGGALDTSFGIKSTTDLSRAFF